MKKSLKFVASCVALCGLFLTGCGNADNPDGPKKDDSGEKTPEVVAVTGVTVTPATAEVEVDSTVALTATVSPANADDKAITWSTNKPTIATVTKTGVVTGVSVGTAEITATTHDGGKTAKSVITVKEAVEPHYCTHICPTCGGCMDPLCQDPACANKCQGHEVPSVDVTFVNGKYILEAEDGDVQGRMTGTDPDDAFIMSKTSDNPAHPTSGTGNVMNWQEAGNTITWRIKLTEEYTKVGFKLWAATGNDQDSSGLTLSVNGQALTWNESKVLGKGFSENKWYYWNDINAKGSLIEGVNTIVLTNSSGQPWNIDSLELTSHLCEHICPICGGCLDTECKDELCATKCPGHNHTCAHICEYCGKCTDETCQDIVCADKCQGHTISEFVNGRYRVPNSNAAGNYTIFSNTTRTVRVEFQADFSSTDLYDGVNHNDNNAVEMRINGNAASNDKVNFGTKDGLACPGTKIYTTSGTWDLVKGENTLSIAVPFQTHVTYDWFEVVEETVARHTCAHVCGECGKCTDTTCMYYECITNRCGGHNHECQHVCDICGKCTDTTCQDLACAEKCQGHKILDLAGGAYRVEAEKYDSASGVSVYDQGEGATLSGGKAVGDFNYGNGSSLIYEIYAKANTSVTLTISYACGMENNYNGAVEVEVNSTHVNGAADHDGHNFGQATDWDSWATDVSVEPITLVAGKNTVKLMAPYGSYTNIDYIEFTAAAHTCSHVCEFCGKCTDETCQETACAEKCPGHKVLDLTQGAFRVEAEDYTSGIGVSTFDQGAGETISGEKGVGDFNFTNGSTLTYEIYAREETPVKLTIAYACGIENNFNGAVEVQLNGAHVNGAADHDGHNFGQATDWHDWATDSSVGTISLVAGKNTVTLIAPYGSYTNLDYIEFGVPTHVCGHICEYCGKCTDETCQDAMCSAKCEGHTISQFVNGRYRIPDSGAAGTYTVFSDAVRTVRVEFQADFTSTDLYDGVNHNDNNAVEMRINGAAASNDKVNFGTKDGLADPGTKIYTTSGTWDLVKGENTITVSVPFQTHVTYDWFEVVEETVTRHACAHVCGDCGLCTDPDCLYYECAAKCMCNAHICAHVCEICGLCTDETCQDPACANKCAGHGIQFTDGKSRIECEAYTSVVGSVSVNDSGTASGGKIVEDYAYGDELEYKFVCEEAMHVYLDVSTACGQNNSDNGAVEINVNGTKLGNFGGVSGWGDYVSTITKSVDLVKGENTIKIICPWGSATNLDYFDIVKTPAFIEGVARVEAEAYTTISGPAHVSDPIEQEVLSGGHGIGDFNTSAVVSYDIMVPEEMTVKIKVCYACGMENNYNGAVEVYLNGTLVQGTAGHDGNNYGALSDWHDWQTDISSATVTLVKGKNTIEFKAPYGSYTNLDYFEIIEIVD